MLKMFYYFSLLVVLYVTTSGWSTKGNVRCCPFHYIIYKFRKCVMLLRTIHEKLIILVRRNSTVSYSVSRNRSSKEIWRLVSHKYSIAPSFSDDRRVIFFLWFNRPWTRVQLFLIKLINMKFASKLGLFSSQKQGLLVVLKQLAN